MANTGVKQQAKLKLKLTDGLVNSLEHQGVGDRSSVADTAVPGLALIIHESGKKSFRYTYRTKSGRRLRRITLRGVFTIGKAREKAKEIAAEVELGGDPLGDREKAAAEISLSEFWDQFYLDHVRSRWKARSMALFSRLWAKLIRPHLGHQPVRALKPADIIAWQKKYQHVPGEANVALRLLKAILNHAVEIEVIPAPSPASRVKLYPRPKRERFLSGEELKVLFAAIDYEEAAGGKASVEREEPKVAKEDPALSEETKPPKSKRGGLGQKEVGTRGITPHAAALFRLLLFTGCRLTEIMHAKWSWVDWEPKTLRLPDSKTGARSIQLSSPALEELRKLEPLRTVGNPYIIEGRTDAAHLINPQKPWGRVRDRAHVILNERRAKAKLEALKENPFANVRLHDLRHSFASIAVASGLGLPIVGKALGHANASTTERYAHLATDPVAAAMEIVGAEILKAVNEPVAVVEEVTITVEVAK